MADIEKERRALVARVLEGPGKASHEQRRAAFDNAALQGPLATLCDKVARAASRITDEDVAAARAACPDEDHVYELVVCAAIGQATRQHDAALALLDAIPEEG